MVDGSGQHASHVQLRPGLLTECNGWNHAVKLKAFDQDGRRELYKEVISRVPCGLAGMADISSQLTSARM